MERNKKAHIKFLVFLAVLPFLAAAVSGSFIEVGSNAALQLSGNVSFSGVVDPGQNASFTGLNYTVELDGEEVNCSIEVSDNQNVSPVKDGTVYSILGGENLRQFTLAHARYGKFIFNQTASVNAVWNLTAVDLLYSFDLVSPNVTLVYPANNTEWNSSGYVNFTYNVSDDSSVGYCNLSINGGMNWSNSSITKGVNQSFNVSLDNGLYNWSVNCTDSAGNTGFSGGFNLSVDVVAPFSVLLDYPVNGTATNSPTPDFNFTVNVSGSYSCELYVNGTPYGLNSSVAGNVSTVIAANTSLTDGAYGWYVNCTLGEETNSSEVRNLTVDGMNPSVMITYPDNEGYLDTREIRVNGTVADANLNYTNVSVYDAWDSIVNSTLNYSSSWSLVLGVQGDGNYTVNVTCYDNGSNFNATGIKVTVDTTEPVVSLTSPAAQYNTSASSIDLIFNVTDNIAETLNCSLYVNGTYVTGNSSTLNNTETAFSGVSVGEATGQNWTVNCSDNANNSHRPAARIFNVDRTSPSIAYGGQSDDDGAAVARNWTWINVSVSDVGVGVLSCLLEWNGTNESMTRDGGICHLNKSDSDGVYTYKVWANDSLGNWNYSETRSISFDVTKPAIWNVTLDPEIVLGNGSIAITVNASDNFNVSAVWATVTRPDGVGNLTLELSASRYTGTFTDTAYQGTYNVTAYANDTAGNVNGTNASFTVSSCVVDSDCGTNGFFGSNYCSNNDIYRGNMTWTCSNGGAAFAACVYLTSEVLVEDCLDSTVISGQAYCSGDKVVIDLLTLIRGCDPVSVKCFSEASQMANVLEVCSEGNVCINASCISGVNATTTTTSTLASTTTSWTNVTSSTTTSVSSTTSTSMPCPTAGDYPPCGEVSLGEVVSFVNWWSDGKTSLGDVVKLINLWAAEIVSATTTTTSTTSLPSSTSIGTSTT